MSKEQLTIKELAPYLPYGLKGYAPDINLIDDITLQNVEFVMSEPHNCKPLLRNLSDLTKEIEVNGEIIDVIDYLKIPFGLATMLCLENIQNMPYRTFEKLLELHFDVFGLIDKGLAIDLNTITNG